MFPVAQLAGAGAQCRAAGVEQRGAAGGCGGRLAHRGSEGGQFGVQGRGVAVAVQQSGQFGARVQVLQREQAGVR
ncbi:hypothetical protein [Streptomyces sp. ADI92-24]|uniref:hypothetical protein n=1 Tax=Streptomyces sp. ADI92-24 TaxID=1522756 RepID=UPI000F4969FC|nr:hypothetical protein [Streptomyces sp. ADI92-24]